MTERAPLILYDGVCGLCDHTVQIILVIDREKRMVFSALQGETAAGVRARHPELAGEDSIVLVTGSGTDERIAVKSDAALGILREIGGFWRLAGIFNVVPRGVRDGIYAWVARNRYRWFGKYDACEIPDAAVRARFLP